MSPETQFLAALAVFAGFAARGFTGFGAVLFTLPVLSLWLPVKQVVPLLSALGIANGLWLTWRARAQIDAREGGLLLLGGLPGVAAGLLLFHRTADVALRGVLGCVVVVLGIWLARGGRTAGGRTWPAWMGGGAGAVGGVLGGLFGLSGPAPVFYLAGRSVEHAALRATLLFYITVVDLLAGTAFTLSGTLSGALWLTGLGLLPVSVLGSWCGERLQQRVSDAAFRRISGAALVLMGLILAARALVS